MPVLVMLGAVLLALGPVVLMLDSVMLGPVMLGAVLATYSVGRVLEDEMAKEVALSILVTPMVSETVRSPIWIWMITSVERDVAFGNKTEVGSVRLPFTLPC